jgi:parallel beta-helix repeat protein
VFLDGAPLFQVASNPAPGQFAVDGSRRVILADDPTGRTVEVTMRTEWVSVEADGVVIRGMTMRHAANAPQSGGVGNKGFSRFALEDSTLSDAHGAVVSLQDGTDLRVIGNDIGRGGDLGLHGHRQGALIRGNRIHHNNTEAFDGGWEAGGVKMALLRGAVWDGNEVHDNAGSGLWCDVDCRDVAITGNRVHHNTGPGIHWETSTGATITGNAVWENGWGFTVWAWGSGILLSSSAGAEVAGNTVAWNGDGIGVLSQARGDNPGVTGITVHDNTVVHAQAGGGDSMALGWVQDHAGLLYAGTNGGANNRYWLDAPEPTWCRFAWQGCHGTLAAFNATPGEEGGRYLTLAERDAALAAAGIPLAPEPR